MKCLMIILCTRSCSKKAKYYCSKVALRGNSGMNFNLSRNKKINKKWEIIIELKQF